MRLHPAMKSGERKVVPFRSATMSTQIVAQVREALFARELRPGDFLGTEKDLAERFGVSTHVVYYWIDRGVIQARRLNAGMPYWITLNETDEQKLRDWVCNSCRIQMAPSTRLEQRAL